MSKSPIEMMLDKVTWIPCPEPEQSDDGIPYCTHEGIFEVEGFKFRVFQLNDGRRVIHQEDFENFFNGLLSEDPCPTS